MTASLSFLLQGKNTTWNEVKLRNINYFCHIINGFDNFFVSFILFALVINIVFVSLTRDCFTCLGVHLAILLMALLIFVSVIIIALVIIIVSTL